MERSKEAIKINSQLWKVGTVWAAKEWFIGLISQKKITIHKYINIIEWKSIWEKEQLFSIKSHLNAWKGMSEMDKSTWGQHHSKKYCRQDPPEDAKTSGHGFSWKRIVHEYLL